jgi:hypothetical protein
MKKLKKIKLSLIIFTVLLVSSSCEKDLYEDVVYQPEKSTIKEVKFDELFKDSKFKNLLQNVSNNSNLARSAFENQNGFTISNTNVKVIQTDSVTSYTMLIQRDSISNSSYFENLVIQEDIFNNQKAFIIKYTPHQIISTVDNSFAFQGEIKKSQIAFTGFNRSGSYQNTTQADCYIEVLMCSYGEDHVAGQGCVDKPNPTLYLKKIAVLCQDNGGGSGGSGDISIGDPFNGGGSSSGSDGDGLGDPFSGGGSNTGGSGTGSTGTNNDGFDNEVVTSPISNQDIINTYLFYNSLSPNQQSWANENVDAYNQLIQYQIDNNWSDQSEEFAVELIDLANNEEDEELISNLINLSIVTKQNGYFENSFDTNYYNLINPYTEVDTQAYNPLWSVYFTTQCAIARYKLSQEPEWNNLYGWQQDTWVYWEASKEMLHLGLDLIGLVPVVGEVADLTNGVIYTIEGDGVNATLSFASTIPIAGWFSAGVKFAKRADGLAYTVKAANNLISFGAYNSKKFRAACGIAVGDATKQAHHILPRGTQIIEHEVVQRAAKATTNQGFHIDQALNGVAVATWRNQPNHNTYNNLIKNKLDDYLDDFPNATPQQCYNKLVQIINQGKQAILNNPNTHLNNITF